MYIDALRALAIRMDEVKPNLTQRKQELDDDCVLKHKSDVNVWDALIDYEKGAAALYIHRSMASYLYPQHCADLESLETVVKKLFAEE